MKTEITYKLFVTDNNNYTYQIGKELSSPAKILAAIRKTSYPPDFSKLNTQWVKYTKTVVEENVNIDIKLY
jgi:hypothetical protein